jgi:hypothetical protein
MQLAESRRGKLSRREKLKGVCLLKLPRLAQMGNGPRSSPGSRALWVYDA